MRVIIAGSRGFNDYHTLVSFCDSVLGGRDDVEIVSGGAKGADRLGERYANDMGYAVTVFPADWDNHGNSAGYRRNTKMAKYADMLIAFWDGKSRGTAHMIDIATAYNLIVYVSDISHTLPLSGRKVI